MKIILHAAAFLALFGSLKLDGADPQRSGSPAPPVTAVETIVFLRHGEKPDKEIGQLNCQGLNRALALPRVLTSKFGKPDYIFAPATSRMSTIGGGGVGFNYIRPLATIEPTAIELGMPVNTDFGYSDIDGLGSELTRQKYQNALIFVAWEHHELENLVKQLVSEYHGNPDEVPHWKHKDFDSLYIVRITSRDTTKSITFTQDHEGLSNLSTGCPDAKQQQSSETTYPIEHLVVIFQENISFDHYFATYPVAANPPGEPRFVAKPGTPTVNGLTPDLLTRNQNALLPQRLDRSHAATADQNHDYPNEQEAMDHGLMDKFVEFTGTPEPGGPTVVMDYFDGNTVTAYWNYAQNFAMNDNSFGSVPGPSTPGAINVISGQTHGAVPTQITGTVEQGSVISDDDPAGDIASGGTTFSMTGKNIGDLLNSKNVTWGWFEGGFDNPAQSHMGANGRPKIDYIPHHQPFQYYEQTANPMHKPPTSVALIGKTDQANHQYDITRFWQALGSHNLPSVSYLKAPGYQDGHPGYSDPLLEQEFVVETVNRLMRSPEWQTMAIIIAYDDSDGWYDHVMPPVVNESQTAYDFITVPGQSGTNAPLGGYQGRYSFGPRMPLIVISQFAKENYVDHTTTDQSSIVRFIEDNWDLGRIGDSSFDQYSGTLLNMFDFDDSHWGHREPHARRLILDPQTGQPVED